MVLVGHMNMNYKILFFEITSTANNFFKERGQSEGFIFFTPKKILGCLGLNQSYTN